ncbi:transmembrane 4 L6 family member 1-like isoform X3 [Rhinolophus ferrumequinum]|uniref:transmembrane 4 L6 family member 1-like isoform X3 n=1 Tax=Rhinolophus ferrumequinum TaxID=59479 RepID=UPI00140F62D1|nr:transmembrane 4 L6 family member 1-like isoform X3 [Rhinolophus ferrumequinum]
MCSETGSRYTGMLLLALATAAIVANLLLYFPNGQVLEPANITDFVWFFHGFLGAGLLVLVPALMLLRGGGEDCCAHRCGVCSAALSVTQAVETTPTLSGMAAWRTTTYSTSPPGPPAKSLSILSSGTWSCSPSSWGSAWWKQCFALVKSSVDSVTSTVVPASEKDR